VSRSSHTRLPQICSTKKKKQQTTKQNHSARQNVLAQRENTVQTQNVTHHTTTTYPLSKTQKVKNGKKKKCVFQTNFILFNHWTIESPTLEARLTPSTLDAYFIHAAGNQWY
jgi:hypothetical protein